MNKSQKGSVVYNCQDCTRRTRSTGQQNHKYNLCAECYILKKIELVCEKKGIYALMQHKNQAMNLYDMIQKKGGKINKLHDFYQLLDKL